jgi:ribosome-interacting GTPase 1
MNHYDNETIKTIITEYIMDHAEQLERAAINIDTLIDEAMQNYDTSVEKIKKDIITSPEVIEDPQQEMRNQIEQLKAQIVTATLAKINTFADISVN